MKAHVDGRNRTKQCLHSLQITCFILLTFAATSALSQNTKCPFNYLYHFGDGFTDIGNSIRVLPYGPFLPATRLPYGKTFPGMPTGRWSDGLIDVDFTARGLGIKNITPYLSMNISRSTNGVIFSVARSPVLEREFYALRGVYVPPYVAPLSLQVRWFKSYLKSVCSNLTDCTEIIEDSIVIFGDIEGNDIGYPLSQGKSIQEVKSYVPFVIDAEIKAAREVIAMGATRVVVPGNVPVGCFPYILTKLQSTNPADYDSLGCLKSVNDLTLYRNNVLQQAVKNLSMEFPSIGIFYADLYVPLQTVINQTTGSEGNVLKACCGIGGKYNFDKNRFCGSLGVPVCSNPNEYVFWDGIYLTQGAYDRFVRILVPPFLPLLNCTTT